MFAFFGRPVAEIISEAHGDVSGSRRRFQNDHTSYPQNIKSVKFNFDYDNQNRSAWTESLTKSLNIAGTNAEPSGTYQAPAGFVQGSNDGTPASAKEQLYVLVNNYGWTMTFN
jgi:hypothetical protein